MPPANHSQQYHRRPAVIRIASHNIRGNTVAFREIVNAWRGRQYHVVGLQEVHATRRKLASELSHIAQQAGYRLVYSACKANPGSAGVAFLLATDVSHTVVRSHTYQDDTGRVLCVHVKFGGRNLWLVNAYVPCAPGDARNFLEHTLAPQMQNVPDPNAYSVMLGDWNFVHDPLLDRMRVDVTNTGPTASDVTCPPVFASAAFAGMLDSFRAKHVGRRVATHFGHYGGARLDRIYVQQDVLPLVTGVGVMNMHEYSSDHRPVYVHVAAAEGLTCRGRSGVKRLRMWFWTDPVLRQTFLQWVHDTTTQAPAAAPELLQWWPCYKAQLAAHVRQLNVLRKQRSQPPAVLWAQYDALAIQVPAAWEALHASTTAPERTAAAAHVQATQRKLAATLAALRRHGQHIDPPPSWVPYNEVPGKAFSAIMAAPPESKVVHALKHPFGYLLGPGAGQANIMVQHYAAISSAPAPQPAALHQVLQALPAHGPTGLPQPEADALGDGAVSVDEVRRALKCSKPGTCPGLDGIPVELFRKAGQPMWQLLAKVFSAMGELNATPSNFLDGVITSIFKAGDPTSPANYRPITLLNTDYRVLAKVLANRCLQHIPHLISTEQCAFLKGRSIGDSIMLLQLLPHQLAAEGHRGALAAFLDFSKAYDSVSREFLREVLLALAVGDKFVAWVMLLLSPDTRACAVVNGFLSMKVQFSAGVRQGCPLAPLLYLFVGEALLRFLKAQPVIGMSAGGARVVAAQYADDVVPVLKGPEAVSVLVDDALPVFASASNQRINVDKCKLLPIGTPAAAALPDAIAGIPVTQSADTLGIKFHAGLGPATPKREWQQLLDGVHRQLDKLGRLSLSAFGRAMGASAYALSRLLFYMEFAGLPSTPQVAALERALAKLVDRANKSGAFTYVRKELLLGVIKHGGFGMLGVQQHVLARHAVLAARLLSGDDSVPWIRIGRALLSRLWGPGWHAMLPLLSDGQHPNRAPHPPHALQNAGMPVPLARILHALQQLPRPRDVAGGLQLGLWCSTAPLMGNPWLRNDHGCVLGREMEAQMLLFGCSTVGGLVHFMKCVATCTSQEWQRCQWGMVPRHLALPHLQRLLEYVPAAWIAAASDQQPHDFSQVSNAVVQTLFDRLGWWVHEPGATVPTSVKVADLTVRTAYRLLIQPTVDLRVSRWKDFIAEATGVHVSCVSDSEVGALQGLLGTVWRRVKWGNAQKVLFWRTCVNGLPTSITRNTGRSCYCQQAGHACPGRKHHLWDCAAAQAVVSELCRCLGVQQLPCRNVWLMELPPEMVPQPLGEDARGVRRVLREVWLVVCLAALHAMWTTAKKVMKPEIRERLAAQPRGLHAVVADAARVHLWALLHDFVRSSSMPGSWRRLLPANTPFLCLPNPGGRLAVNDTAGGFMHRQAVPSSD